ncbi:hypothetical protein MTR_8g090155 [Medicago truncatula]|uniref:Uncharacterized protein n=1 Tax=Medicago truncatula TaxID=3880 RepID=A0A072U4R7_MEDTR|nr:hypothetical protein MTR_8g090155 [Medicago truncatula]
MLGKSRVIVNGVNNLIKPLEDDNDHKGATKVNALIDSMRALSPSRTRHESENRDQTHWTVIFLLDRFFIDIGQLHSFGKVALIDPHVNVFLKIGKSILSSISTMSLLTCFNEMSIEFVLKQRMVKSFHPVGSPAAGIRSALMTTALMTTVNIN